MPVALTFLEDPAINWLNSFLQNYGYVAALLVAALILIALAVILIVSLRRRKALTRKSELNNAEELKKALGGPANIVSHSLKGSRITLELKDYEAVDEKRLNALGVTSVIKMSDSLVLVVREGAGKLYESLFD